MKLKSNSNGLDPFVYFCHNNSHAYQNSNEWEQKMYTEYTNEFQMYSTNMNENNRIFEFEFPHTCHKHMNERLRFQGLVCFRTITIEYTISEIEYIRISQS